MKTILSLIITFSIALTINAQEFKFESEIIDYGTITQGSDGKRVYNFINIGDAPLIIKSIRYDCCAYVKGPEKPIFPGEKGVVKLSLYTKRLGVISEIFNIYSNAKEESKILKFKAHVVSPESVLTEQYFYK